MTRTALFLPYPSSSGTWGSTVMMAAIAEECRRDGYRVVVHACPPASDLLRRHRVETVEFAGAPAVDDRRPQTSFYDVCRSLGFDDLEFWRRVLAAEAEVIDLVRPDILISHFRLTAAVSAARSALPLASVAFRSTDPRLQGHGRHHLDEIARTLAWEGAGLRVDTLPELMSWHADAQLAPCHPAFEPELAGAPGLVYTGGIRSPYGARVDRPTPARLILCYSSSAPWGTDRVLRSLGTAAARSGATMWCATRAGATEITGSGPGVVLPYLPFDQLLPRASAVIFHGGYSTAVATLQEGVPALAIPGLHYERRANALRLEELGTGIAGELGDLRPSRLTANLERLLDETETRRRLTAARADTIGYPGARRAAEVINGLLDGISYRDANRAAPIDGRPPVG